MTDSTEDRTAHAPRPEPLFEHDASDLPLALRTALVKLLKSPFIDGMHPRHEQAWTALEQHEAQAEAWLNGIFLSLDLNRETRTAFKRPAEGASGLSGAMTPVRSEKYSIYEAALLIWLRAQWVNAAGLRQVWVKRSDMLEHLDVVMKPSSTDMVAEQRAQAQAISRLAQDKILMAPKGERADEAEEFGVSPVLPHLLTAARLQEFKDALDASAETEGELA